MVFFFFFLGTPEHPHIYIYIYIYIYYYYLYYFIFSGTPEHPRVVLTNIFQGWQVCKNTLSYFIMCNFTKSSSFFFFFFSEKWIFWHYIILYRDSSTQNNDHSVIIYSSSCCSEPVWIYFCCLTQNKIFWRMLVTKQFAGSHWLPWIYFFIFWKSMATSNCLVTLKIPDNLLKFAWGDISHGILNFSFQEYQMSF